MQHLPCQPAALLAIASDHRRDLVVGEARDGELLHHASTGETIEVSSRLAVVRELGVAYRRQEQEARARIRAQHVLGEVERRGVSPLEVVYQQHDGVTPGDGGEELGDGFEQQEAVDV